MEIRDHQELGEGQESRIWDCGSRLYDSYELASVVRHIERHMGSPPPMSSTAADHHPAIISSMEGRSSGRASNMRVVEDRRRSWFARSSTIWRRNVRSPNSATTVGKEKEKEESTNNLGYGICKSLASWKSKN